MRVDFIAEPGACPEKIMVEVQGTVEPPLDPEGKTCLYLYHNSPNGAICLIGHQMIEGVLRKLERPLLVVDTASRERVDSERFKCRVAYVIRQKMVFKARPKPILC